MPHTMPPDACSPKPHHRRSNAGPGPMSRWQRRVAGTVFACALALAGAGCQSAATSTPVEPEPSSTASLRHTDHPLVDRTWDVAGQRFVPRSEVVARLRAADVILLGETHDNPVHHRLQTALLSEVLGAGRKPVIVMEQFDTEQQTALDAATSPEAALALMPRGWDSPQYSPIIAAARTSQLPLVAGNVSRTATRPVIREGWQAVETPRREMLHLEAVWDAERETYMRKVITASHCGQIDGTLRDGIVRAQRLRDAVLADVALGRRAASPDGSVVFIVGRGHARSDVGVPRYLQARARGLKVLSIGFTEVDAGKAAPSDYLSEDGIAPPGTPHDLLWFTPRQTRPDPCADFGKR